MDIKTVHAAVVVVVDVVVVADCPCRFFPPHIIMESSKV